MLTLRHGRQQDILKIVSEIRVTERQRNKNMKYCHMHFNREMIGHIVSKETDRKTMVELFLRQVDQEREREAGPQRDRHMDYWKVTMKRCQDDGADKETGNRDNMATRTDRGAQLWRDGETYKWTNGDTDSHRNTGTESQRDRETRVGDTDNGTARYLILIFYWGPLWKD
jgi:hypothetical protein